MFQQDSAPAHRARETLLSSYVERRAGLYFTGTGATEQSGGLQNLGYNVAARLPDKDSKC